MLKQKVKYGIISHRKTFINWGIKEMLGKNKAQFDMFDIMIFDKLITKNHLLIEIDEVVDFSFVYDQLKDH